MQVRFLKLWQDFHCSFILMLTVTKDVVPVFQVLSRVDRHLRLICFESLAEFDKLCNLILE